MDAVVLLLDNGANTACENKVGKFCWYAGLGCSFSFDCSGLWWYDATRCLSVQHVLQLLDLLLILHSTPPLPYLPSSLYLWLYLPLSLLTSTQEGATALIKAAHFGHLKIVGLLLDRGAGINRTDQVRYYSSTGNCELFCSQGTMIMPNDEVVCGVRCHHLSFAYSHDFTSFNPNRLDTPRS